MSRRNVPIEVLQTFVLLVANGGNAKETAERLAIQQPTMSKRLRLLKFPGKRLDHPWIFREGKTWFPTTEGKRVLPAVRELIARYEQLRTFAANGEPDHAEVRFGCGRQAATRFVRRAARRFWAKHPAIQLRVSMLPGPARVEGVANGSLDLATVAHSDSRIREIARRELHVETLFSDRLALVCRPNTRWAKVFKKLPKFKVGPEALAGFPLLLPAVEAGVRVTLNDALRDCHLLDQLEIRLEVSSWTAIMSYASDGVGVGLVSESAVARPSKMLVRYLDPAVIPPFTAKLISRRTGSLTDQPDLTPEARLFYRAVKQAAKRRWG